MGANSIGLRRGLEPSRCRFCQLDTSFSDSTSPAGESRQDLALQLLWQNIRMDSSCCSISASKVEWVKSCCSFSGRAVKWEHLAAAHLATKCRGRFLVQPLGQSVRVAIRCSFSVWRVEWHRIDAATPRRSNGNLRHEAHVAPRSMRKQKSPAAVMH
jgi:hypothetical protein